MSTIAEMSGMSIGLIMFAILMVLLALSLFAV